MLNSYYLHPVLCSKLACFWFPGCNRHHSSKFSGWKGRRSIVNGKLQRLAPPPPAPWIDILLVRTRTGGGKMDGIAVVWSRGSRGPQYHYCQYSNKHLHKLPLTFRHCSSEHNWHIPSQPFETLLWSSVMYRRLLQ
jgi:hypothetical protein